MPLSAEDEALLKQASAEFDQRSGAPSSPPPILVPPRRLPKGGEPVFGFAPTGLKPGQTGPPRPSGLMDTIQAYPGWTGTALRAVIPQTPTEGILDAANLAMFGPLGPEASTGMKAAVRGLRSLSVPRKLGLGTGIGMLSNYLQGKSPLAGGVQGGAQTLTGAAFQKGGDLLGDRRFRKAMEKVDPRQLAGPIAKAAPWLANIVKKVPDAWNHLDFQRLFQRPSSEKRVGDQFRQGLDTLENQAKKITNGTPAFGSKAMEKLDSNNKGRMIPLREALDTIMDLRSGGYIRGVEAKGGMSAQRLRQVRTELVGETEDYLNRISGGSLGQEYGDLRRQMGRSMAFMRLFNAKDIVKNRKINMELAHDRWMNQKQLGLDIENWLDQPGEFEEMERTLFRGGDPSTPDVAPQGVGAHFYATPTLKPHGYFKFGQPGKTAGFPGSRFGGATGAYAAGRGIGGAQGEWMQKQPPPGPLPVIRPSEEPDAVPMGAPPADVLKQARAHPELQGLSDEEIQQLYEMASRGR